MVAQNQQEAPLSVNTSVQAMLGWLDIDTSIEVHQVRIIRDSEVSIPKQTQATIIVSEVDRQLLKLHHPGCYAHTISNIVPLGSLANSSSILCLDRHGILFIGSFAHSPNGQAIRHLLEDILSL